MSGDIFQPMETQDDPDYPATRNPLLCYLCNEPYEEPCLLGCFHSFCTRCLRGRSSEGKLVCPLCGYVHTLKDGSHLPPVDLLLKFMVEASTEERAQCANCDCSSVQMFFCNTCMQPLCSQCREETHRAKMFSSHDMVLLTKRAREVHKKCKIHEEPYIMFSSEKKIMLCINCFRDMRIESRGHCLDLETAYKQSCKKLDLKVQAFRELQNSVREGILLFRGLVEEIKTNADKERKAIVDLHVDLIKRLDETRLILLQKVDSQYSEKENTFRSQLKSLSALVPTLHTHLVISSAFSGSANKFEFLDLSYVSSQRLLNSSNLLNWLNEKMFKKCLLTDSVQFSSFLFLRRVSAVSTGTSCPGSPVISKITPTHIRRSNGLNGAKVKFIDAKGQFAEHCREFENAHRDLLQRFEQMKSQCQELQRDLTMRRCLAKKDEVLRLGVKIEDVQSNLDRHYSILENKLPLLEKHWEESLDRIVNEQDLYQAQLQDVMRLKQESQHLRVITSQLVSFVSSIAAVTERLAPKLGQSSQISDQENQMASLLDEINAVQPDSQLRVDAIRGAEEERLTQIANRTNPLDDELIKTKGLLRCPSLRSMKGDRRKSRQDKEINVGISASDKETLVSAVDENSSSESSQSGPSSRLLGDATPLALPSTLSTSQDKTSVVFGTDSQHANLDSMNSKAVGGFSPSPSIPCSQGDSTTSHVVEASCEVQSGGKTASVLNGPIVKTSDFQADDKSTMSNTRCPQNDESDTSSKVNEKSIGSYVSLAAHAEFTSKYLKDSNAHAAGSGHCYDSSHVDIPQTASQHPEHKLDLDKRGSSGNARKFHKDKREKNVTEVEARKELMKDVENFKKKESLTSPRKLPSNSGDSI
ncbi:hypothetical protein EGW08_001324 [Elysia chlorotica]|uniref:RING finger protein 207 n=1 Tax=Elysia chlorotica TaxID=188477 RepID=A0A433UAS7_ELYCH|nr:hypothetical protein EGW08_001324 [Elysia chlorotica]